MAKKKKKTKKDKTLEKVGIGFGVAGGLLLTWYGVNRYKIWLDNRKMLEGATTAITGGGTVGGGIGTGTNVVCKGDTKNEVNILQSYLKRFKGQTFPRFGVDGDWGSETTTAVTNVYGPSKNCFTKGEIDAMLAYLL